ncbi:MFS transporter [Xanthomonas fragariae]|uniref:MFS transporter n=1 Tax=Xanthomonas fragariae TaxID=48664 RepID=UPI001EE06AE7|nr:MFS transporter [Xanthomonas fragariae]
MHGVLLPGFAASIWAVLVPFAKARTGVDDGALGLILLCLGAGSFVAMPLAGALSARFGPRAVTVTIATVALICISLPFLALVADQWLLGAVVLVFGAGVGAMDCVMNMQAVAVERDAERAMMSGLPAFFSIGGFVGAGAMTLLLSAQIGPLTAAIVGVLAMLVVGALSVRYWRTERVWQDGPWLALPKGAYCSSASWRRGIPGRRHHPGLELGVPGRCAPGKPCQAGVGYVAFALTMTVTRLLGDAVVERLGRIRSIVVGALLASAGVLVLTLVSPWQASLAG